LIFNFGNETKEIELSNGDFWCLTPTNSKFWKNQGFTHRLEIGTITCFDSLDVKFIKQMKQMKQINGYHCQLPTDSEN